MAENCPSPRRIWITRGLIAAVLAMNVWCALVFLLRPAAYAPAYQLSGAPGEAAVRGFGVLFLMWNIPYLAALWNPAKNRSLLLICLAMQALGVAGELLILFTIPREYAQLRSSIVRFSLFDFGGLLALLAALGLTLISE
ncbi:MAG: hypothetical protein B6D39_05550 [Anaerolineae bacterium UTCFX2]|jgi:hypothetical protein|nr:hypothetical protein [Anaerolineae bacterium]MCZ7552372.1 hypothetical protein [Anaerolineales bacterium]OQY91832.1 MAG: hypothetical protein B6D39_05550 [Anaerolineae bacterium UTCFX2]